VDEIPEGEEDKYIKFVCPCDNIVKYYTYVVNVKRAAESIV
jgi:hypothetical protein